MKLSEFNYKIEYMSGKKNTISDVISRSAVEPVHDVGSINVFGIEMSTNTMVVRILPQL